MIISRVKPKILICEDDDVFQMALRQLLRDRFELKFVKNTDQARDLIRTERMDLLLLDISMRSEREGLEALPTLRALDADLTIVMLSGRSDLENIREAMRKGADDFLPKGCEPSEIIATLERVLETRRKTANLKQTNSEIKKSQNNYKIIGSSSKMKSLQDLIEKVKTKPVNVVIYGETGTGKELVARLIRSENETGSLCPFVPVDSSTITGTLAESILFGHEKGAFTGAEHLRRGIFEEANGGIVFFDEIGNMPLEIQSKLLRVLQEKEITRVGSAKTLPVEFRVVAATNRSLNELVRARLFKDDLFQRLNVIPISLPPLRERVEDIPELVDYFASKFSPGRSFSPEAIDVLLRYSWPGNIRELQNLVVYVLTMSEADIIEISDLPPLVRDAAIPQQNISLNKSESFYERVAAFEAKILAEALAQSDGNMSKLALKLGMDRSHLYSKLKAYKLSSTSSSKNSKENLLANI